MRFFNMCMVCRVLVALFEFVFKTTLMVTYSHRVHFGLEDQDGFLRKLCLLDRLHIPQELVPVFSPRLQGMRSRG